MEVMEVMEVVNVATYSGLVLVELRQAFVHVAVQFEMDQAGVLLPNQYSSLPGKFENREKQADHRPAAAPFKGVLQ